MKLYQICGNEVDERDRNRLRIRIDGTEFSYGSPEYIARQNDEVYNESIVEHTVSRILLLTAYSKPIDERVKPKEKDETYTPDKANNPHIGV